MMILKRSFLRFISLQGILVLTLSGLTCWLILKSDDQNMSSTASIYWSLPSNELLQINGHAFNGTLRNEAEYFEILKILSGSCRKLLSIGGFYCNTQLHGDKKICMDDRLDLPQGECLVYSFGIEDDLTFEDDLHHLLNCEIHMYDLGLNASWLNEELDEKVHHHQIGLSGTNEGGGDPILLLTFDQILKENGHVGRAIHYLKIDVYSFEWEILFHLLKNDLLDNVWQLSMGIHVDHLRYQPFHSWLPMLQRQYNILARIEEIGFMKIFYRANCSMVGTINIPYEKDSRPLCGEVFYIRDPKTISTMNKKGLSTS